MMKMIGNLGPDEFGELGSKGVGVESRHWFFSCINGHGYLS